MIDNLQRGLEPIQLELVEVTEAPSGRDRAGRRPFSILFLGLEPNGKELAQERRKVVAYRPEKARNRSRSSDEKKEAEIVYPCGELARIIAE